MNPEKEERHDIYIIPPNFIDTGSIFGGMFKLRNAIESGIAVTLTGFPILNLPLSLTTKIIVLCLTALPLGLLALIGINGESLSSFIINFFKFMTNRRIIRQPHIQPEPQSESEKSNNPIMSIFQCKFKNQSKEASEKSPKKKQTEPKDEIAALKQQLRKAKRIQKVKTPSVKAKKTKQGADSDTEQQKSVTATKKKKALTVSEYLPIEKIENGIIFTKDSRYVKIIEVTPLNFLLRSAREQRNIIYSFISFLKISPVRMQFKVLTKRADINKHLRYIREEAEKETDERCQELQEDYEQLIRKIGSKEAVTRRFFIIFEYESFSRRGHNEIEAISALKTVTQTAKTFLLQCGNEVVDVDNEDEFTTDVLYNILNRKTSADKPLSERVSEVMTRYMSESKEGLLDNIPVTDFIAPDSIDLSHGKYAVMDGVYHAYMLVPSTGVAAGWLSVLVNAGDGIDVDMFCFRQPKDRIAQKLGQQLRINRSKLKDASDTNTDFDDIEGAIRSGYFLKEGLANNEDSYYISLLVTVTSESLDELEWRVAEMKKLMISQDLDFRAPLNQYGFERMMELMKQVYPKFKF